ncbi:ATP synthase F1 subunit gamma [Adlercreutzia mucosicola]|uniref:ATP synthase F1 subunit gamma n=1 Tax=Adlercreutzia mucosicola TaxID=580026 RepID=UPI00040A273D|nr:ATP synthase F1 subunit gamma [Adlercreutzia mucosicola]MCR2035782.1 ATP synthase F1 subunit gamma [Adlercreutzia mucosicola]MEB1812961.1 ATP synthase F1 subunit gamma [Adlercreutzia mucosicola]
MPNLHDIERRIKSVSSTKQITRTMEMVAAAKIRRASERVENALPWAVAISDMLISTAKYAPIGTEPLLQTHDEVRRVLIVAVTSDRGLAGGFNSNVLRYVEKLMKQKQREGAEVEVAACGKKAIGYFTYRNIAPVFSFAGYSADPEFAQAAELAGYVMEAYREGKLDEVFIVYNHAKNAAEQTLVEQQVLPIKEESYAELLGLKAQEEDIFKNFREKDDTALPGDIDFEPSSESVMSYMLNAYLNNAFFYAMLDSAAGEQGARRNAMKSATDNANEMVSTLERVYNTVRQGAITTEITEIVGGAAALED